MKILSGLVATMMVVMLLVMAGGLLFDVLLTQPRPLP